MKEESRDIFKEYENVSNTVLLKDYYTFIRRYENAVYHQVPSDDLYENLKLIEQVILERMCTVEPIKLNVK